MLSRFKRLFNIGGSNSVSEAAAAAETMQSTRVGRRGGTSYRRSVYAPQPPPTYTQIPPQGSAVPPAATAAANTPPKFDTMKILRTGFVLLGTGFFLSRLFTDPNNPDSFVNRALNPRGRSRYVLKVEKLDDTLSSYKSAFLVAEQGMKPALMNQSRYQVAKKMGVDLSSLTDEQFQALLSAGKFYRMIMAEHAKRIEELKTKQLQAIRTHLDSQPTPKPETTKHVRTEQEIKELIDSAKTDTSNSTATTAVPLIDDQLRGQMVALLDNKIRAEVAFMKAIENILSKEQKSKLELNQDPTMLTKIKNALLGFDTGKYEFIMEKIANISAMPAYENPRVFVLTFKGDMMASQVSRLREEITAILDICDIQRGDQVLVNVNSGGGTVTGYGLAAAQLLRLKNAGLHVTVSVDEVAASGGYLMASVADRIIASPFAILGSIGVVATIPNFSERLQREGVTVEDVTAGKYKRTLTPYKKAKEEDRAKVKSDVENILTIFKDFLKQNRPKLDVDTLATGETWHGPEAKRLGLVDDLLTSDDFLMNLRKQGADIYAVNLKAMAPRFSDAFEDDQHVSLLDDDSGSIWSSMKFWMVKWLSGVVKAVVQETVLGGAADPLLPSSSSSNNNIGYDYSALQKPSYASTEINQRVLAVDPRSYPPMM